MIRRLRAHARITLGIARPDVGRLREIAGVARATLRMSKETDGNWLSELRLGCFSMVRNRGSLCSHDLSLFVMLG